jgi:hypothetical protein
VCVCVCVCVVGSMWLCRDEHEVTVISHNNFICTVHKISRNGSCSYFMRNTLLAGNSEERRPFGRSRRRWDHSVKLDRDEFMRLMICETITLMCCVEIGIRCLSQWLPIAIDGNCVVAAGHREREREGWGAVAWTKTDSVVDSCGHEDGLWFPNEAVDWKV